MFNIKIILPFSIFITFVNCDHFLIKTQNKQPKLNGSTGRINVTSGNYNGKDKFKLKRADRKHMDYLGSDSYEDWSDESYDVHNCDPETHNCKNIGPPPRKTPSCQTTKGEKCIFPFTYNGVAYERCTQADHSVPWCSTKTDFKGTHVSGKWGECSSSCLQGAPPNQPVSPSPRPLKQTNLLSGQCKEEEDNTAYFKNNLCGGSGWDGRPCSEDRTKEECKHDCEKEVHCQFWSWHKRSGRCYLKNKRENVSKNTQYVSGCKSDLWRNKRS